MRQFRVCMLLLSTGLMIFTLLYLFLGLFSSDSTFFCALIPIKIYSNAEVDKDKILSDNSEKSGIYMLRNYINAKRYVGSSENLSRRFSEYFNENYLMRTNYMYICRALLKHGYSKFSLSILEYCEPSKCLEREDYYLKLWNPEYNIAKNSSAPFTGRKHTKESKQIISDAKKGQPRPKAGSR